MKYYGGWSFTEAYNLPVTVRRWFLEKINKSDEERTRSYGEVNEEI